MKYELYSNLALYNSPHINSMLCTTNKINNNSSYAAKIGPKTYLCYGFISVAETIQAGEAVFGTKVLQGGSSLVLIGATNNGYATLLYGSNGMYLPNTALNVGFYYLVGCLIEK